VGFASLVLRQRMHDIFKEIDTHGVDIRFQIKIGNGPLG
jgi:hypothetical protein